MGFKRVICSICNQEVNKAQTYHVGGTQRACKAHEGVSEKKDTLQKREVEKKLREAAAQEQRRAERFNHLDFEPGKLRCALCCNYGLRSDSFFARVLLERSKAEQIYGTFNPFDSKHPGNQIKITERCVFVLGKEKLLPILHLLRGDFKQIFEIIGAAGVCALCCSKHRIDPLPKIEFDELMRFSVYFETFVKPTVDKLARSEMAPKN